MNEKIKILDLGCGNGINSISLANQHPEDLHVIGIDINPDKIKQAQELSKGITNIEFKTGSALEIPLEKESVHSIQAKLLFSQLTPKIDTHHLDFKKQQHEQNTKQVFKEINRVLKPGGNVIIQLTNEEHAKTTAQLILDGKIEFEPADEASKQELYTVTQRESPSQKARKIIEDCKTCTAQLAKKFKAETEQEIIQKARKDPQGTRILAELEKHKRAFFEMSARKNVTNVFQPSKSIVLRRKE